MSLGNEESIEIQCLLHGKAAGVSMASLRNLRSEGIFLSIGKADCSSFVNGLVQAE